MTDDHRHEDSDGCAYGCVLEDGRRVIRGLIRETAGMYYVFLSHEFLGPYWSKQDAAQALREALRHGTKWG